MSAQKRARGDEAAAMGGAGGPPPPPTRRRPATRSVVAADAYERRLKLTDIIGFVAQNGYAREANACAGLCRETWRCIPAGLSVSDADRVRRDHPLWQAIVDLGHGGHKKTRLSLAASYGDLARVRELCDWRADVGARDAIGWTALHVASFHRYKDCALELITRGADVNAIAGASNWTPLFFACLAGHAHTVRLLLAAGADKRRVDMHGRTAHYFADDTIRALLDAAP